MARIKRGVHGLKHRRKVMKLVKGFRAARRRNYRVANEALLHSLAYAYRDRRVRKRDFRALWIARINAAARREGLTYSRLIAGLKKSGSWSTARCWPSWPSTTRPPSRACSRRPRTPSGRPPPPKRLRASAPHFSTIVSVTSATVPMTGSRRVPFMCHSRRSICPTA